MSVCVCVCVCLEHFIAQLDGAVEYTDCFSAESKDHQRVLIWN